MNVRNTTRLALLALLIAGPASIEAQRGADFDEGGRGLALALRKLPVTSSFLETTAHPDDEDNPLFVMLGRGRGLRTGLLTVTRGDGGQNEIGPELFQALGIVRSGELEAVHRYDGAEQFFTRAFEFGYSFSVEETLQKWGREEILADIVRVIRTFRPDVITTLPRTGTGGGQHHQTIARLTQEAFRAAADPARFPEQIKEGLRPWQAFKLYERAGWGEGGESQTGAAPVQMQSWAYDPVLGRTWAEVGGEARSMHRCQGMSQILPLPGQASSRYRLVDAAVAVDPAEKDIFDGIDGGLSGILRLAGEDRTRLSFLQADLAAIGREIDRTTSGFDAAAPEKSIPPLAAGLRLVRQLSARIKSSAAGDDVRENLLFAMNNKESEFEKALRLAHQLRLDAVTDDGAVVPGQAFNLTVNLSNGGPAETEIRTITLKTAPGWKVEPVTAVPSRIGGRSVGEVRYRVTVAADAAATQPFWIRDPAVDRYEIRTGADPIRQWDEPPVSVEIVYGSDGVTASMRKPAEYRYQGPWVGGEQRHELMVMPVVSIRVSPDISILPLGAAGLGKEVRATVVNNSKSAVSGTLLPAVPQGWKVSPSRHEVSLEREGQSVTRVFKVTPPAGVKEGEFPMSVVGQFGGREYRSGHQVIDYHHIQRRHLYHPAEAVIKTVDVRLSPGIRVGYVMGVGDRVPEALRQLGVETNLLNEEELAFSDLGEYNVIVTGVRAYENREDLRAYNSRLLDWVEAGGVMLVQYNKFEFNDGRTGPEGPRQTGDSPFAPFPAQVGRGRVTDENAPVRILEPANPVFASPNIIGEGDWGGWVQERGLYFLDRKDARYRDLVATEDPFEYNRGEKRGALVEAVHGKGKWIYIGLGLWRQLPAGVPGAYRLLANLLSLAGTSGGR